MASTLNKIGLSLLKYFKPVRTTPVHRIPKEFAALVQTHTHSEHDPREFSKHQEKLKKEFKPFQQPAAEEKLVSEQVFAAASSSQKQGANWVDLVVFLVGACRKVADKIRQKGGVQFYRTTIDRQAAQRIRTLGAIVDTTTDDIDFKTKPKQIKKVDEAA